MVQTKTIPLPPPPPLPLNTQIIINHKLEKEMISLMKLVNRREFGKIHKNGMIQDMIVYYSQIKHQRLNSLVYKKESLSDWIII